MQFTKGQIPWNKGTRGLMKAWNKGQVGVQVGWSKGLTKNTNPIVRKIAEFKVGKTRPDLLGNKFREGIRPKSWRGGITPANRLERIKFGKTMRMMVFKRDDYTCQLCGARRTPIQVDHVMSWSGYPDLRFDLGNCRTLCAKCHYLITFGRSMSPDTRTWGHNLKFVRRGGG